MSKAKPAPLQSEINASLLATDHLINGIGGHTARGGMIAIVAQFLRLIVQIGTTSIFARILLPEDFGVVALGMTAFAFISIFTELGISTATVQLRRLDQDTASAFLMISMCVAALSAIVAFLIGPVIGWFFSDPRIPQILFGVSLAAPVGALGSQHFAILMRNMKWISMQTIGLGSLILGAAAGILSVLLFDAGYWALIVQSITSAMVSSLLAWIVCPWKPSIVRDWSGTRGALKFGLNFNATMIINFLYRQLDSILIGWRWGATELGFYSRAYNLLQAPINMVTGPLSSAIVPALSRLHGAEQFDKWRTAYLDALIVVTTIGGGLTAILFGAAPTIVYVVFGPGWEETQSIFSYLSIAMLSTTANYTTGWIYISTNRADRMLHWTLMCVPVFVISYFVGLPYGASGVALGFTITQIAVFIPCFWMALRETNITLMDVLRVCAPNILVTLLIGALLRVGVDQGGLVVDMLAIAAACAAYMGLMILVGWCWPPYRRVRDRGVAMLAKPLTRLGLNATRS